MKLSFWKRHSFGGDGTLDRDSAMLLIKGLASDVETYLERIEGLKVDLETTSEAAAGYRAQRDEARTQLLKLQRSLATEQIAGDTHVETAGDCSEGGGEARIEDSVGSGRSRAESVDSAVNPQT